MHFLPNEKTLRSDNMVFKKTGINNIIIIVNIWIFNLPLLTYLNSKQINSLLEAVFLAN